MSKDHRPLEVYPKSHFEEYIDNKHCAVYIIYNYKRYDVKLNYLNKRISLPKFAVYQTFSIRC